MSQDGAAPLILTPAVIAALRDLRTRAAAAPVDILAVQRALQTREGRRAHRRRMHRLTVPIPGPWPFFVTFSIETGQPAGTCRHLSMSVLRAGRVPHPAAVEMVIAEMGFHGGLAACQVWPEQLGDGGTAINVVQPIAVVADVKDA